MKNEELVTSLLLASEAAALTRHVTWAELMGKGALAIEKLSKDAVMWESAAKALDEEFQNLAQQIPPGWIPVSEKLPEANVDVLALYEWTDQFHKEKKYTNICRASYIPKDTVLVDDKWSEVDDDWEEYWEAPDSYYVPEGWYEECSRGNGDDVSYSIQATVTHWMPLPPAPNEFFESLKRGIEQAINGETREIKIEVGE